MTRRAALSAVLAIALAGCGDSSTDRSAQDRPTRAAGDGSPASGTAASAPVRAGTLKLFYWQAPLSLNPHLATGTKDLSAARITYEPLATAKPDGSLLPVLAAEVPSHENGGLARDFRWVTWKLKPGLKWSDGRPVTADDVRFTWQFVTDTAVKSTSTAAFSGIADVHVIDPLTVRIAFDDVNPAWATAFVGVLGMVIPRHAFAGYKGANATKAPANAKPVGTGAYRVRSFKAEDVLIIGGEAVETTEVVYEPNPYYRDRAKPAFSRLELSGGGGDAVAAAEAVRDGRADFAWNIQVPDARAADIESRGKGTTVKIPGAFTERIMLNFSDPRRATASGERSSVRYRHPAFSDVRVRRAVVVAIDRERIARFWGPGNRPTGNLLVAPPAFASSRAPAPWDPAKARRLLDQAGWRDRDGDGVREQGDRELRIVFQTSINPVRQKAQAVVKRDLERVGFAVRLKNIDSSIFLGPVKGTTSTRSQFYADLEQFAYNNKTPDPGAYMRAWTCDAAAQKANQWSQPNWSRYCDRAYDRLYEKAARELDPARRAELFKRMNDRLIDEAAVIPLVHIADTIGVSTRLRGVELTPWDVEVWNIADWTRE